MVFNLRFFLGLIPSFFLILVGFVAFLVVAFLVAAFLVVTFLVVVFLELFFLNRTLEVGLELGR